MAQANELAATAAEQARVAESKTAQSEGATPEEKPQAAESADAASKDAAGTVTTEPAKEKTFTQAELDEIISKRIAKEHRKAQREADRRLAEALAERKPVQPETVSVGKPDPSKFATTEEYIEAVADWRAGERLREYQEKQVRESAEAKARQDQTAARTAHVEREDAARDKYDDYEEVVFNPNLVISDVMAQAIQLSEQGPDVAYYLGKNPAEAARIAKLPPILAVKELGKLEAKVAAAPAASAPTRTPSRAPDPISPVKGNAVTASDEPRDSDPIAVWMQKREAQLKRERANR